MVQEQVGVLPESEWGQMMALRGAEGSEEGARQFAGIVKG
jgi:hypothetical protein